MAAGFNCPKCGIPVNYHKTICDRGHFVGYPNIRLAEEMRVQLQGHYNAAVADAAGRGCAAQVAELEALLQATVATINVDAKVLRNMSLSQNYMSYYRALAEGARQIAERQLHAHRAVVDAKVHTGYESSIINAAASPNGHGLINYGQITLELQSVAIEDRASVMRENSYLFYLRFKLGDRDAQEQPGWRSIWPDRALLGVAHFAPDVSTASGRDDLLKLVFSVGTDRDADRYLEVHIFNEITWQSLAKVTLERPLTEPEDRDDWDFGRQRLSARGVPVVDLVNP